MMIPSWATSYTPFFMVYGSEAILPTDHDYAAPRVRAYALLRSAKYQQVLHRYHSRWVRGWAFNIGDLVLYLV